MQYGPWLWISREQFWTSRKGVSNLYVSALRASSIQKTFAKLTCGAHER